MKIAICAQDARYDAMVDARFGRAACFAVYDDKDDAWKFLLNQQNLNSPQGAGIQSAQCVIDADVDVLLSENVGPKAMAALAAAGVDVYQLAGTMTVTQALEQFQADKLTKLDQANVEGHWA